jgi:DNA-binding MarR family transcriptional regulator
VTGVEELMLADFDEEERETFAALLRRARHSLDQQGHRPA